MLKTKKQKNKKTEKLDKLKIILSDMHSVVIAYSGGVDSTFLLRIAHDVLGDKVLAVIARSGTYQKKEYGDALKYASLIGVKVKVIETEELDDPKFKNNPPERCYYCKKELFCKLKEITKKEGYLYIIYGATISDIGDFRPGANAAHELGIRAPLQEAGLNKDEIRKLSKKIGLETWDKSSMACLASRFPYGEKITEKKLSIIEQAEEYINSLGFRNVRVRVYNKLARVEVDKSQIMDILLNSAKEKIVKKLKGLGFNYVTLDLEGYRSGSMNEVFNSNK